MQVSSTRRFSLLVVAVLSFLLPGQGVRAACLLGMVGDPVPLVIPASYGAVAAVPAGNIRIRYLGHSSFEIETPGGARMITDYNGYNVGAGGVPDAVMMNNSHESHYTDNPDPRIRYVLRGWKPGGGIARHDVRFKDVHIFNVPTNIGEHGDPGSNGNSLFVIEVSGLCIAHTGHLHHVLTREQLAKIGRIDVLFVPVDGSMTMTHQQALENIRLIAPRLVIPMHFGFTGSPELFFELAKEHYKIDYEDGNVLIVNRAMLPKRTEIRFLQAGF